MGLVTTRSLPLYRAFAPVVVLASIRASLQHFSPLVSPPSHLMASCVLARSLADGIN